MLLGAEVDTPSPSVTSQLRVIVPIPSFGGVSVNVPFPLMLRVSFEVLAEVVPSVVESESGKSFGNAD